MAVSRGLDNMEIAAIEGKVPGNIIGILLFSHDPNPHGAATVNEVYHGERPQGAWKDGAATENATAREGTGGQARQDVEFGPRARWSRL